ncbi:LPXTG cell wall anchor domain-containing protein [Streptomyces sp. NPDC048361]|uniref:LPXTG cell wall anchor domain-containing protein n=1 Tax=Streptomyces sp. NPDC048361 TaxID=3154720 RepID=UPI00343EFB41
MNIRRILATTVAAAVTAPAVLLSVSPASAAEARPAAPSQKSTYAELEKAAADATKAYDTAVQADSDQQALLDKLMRDDAPEAKPFRDAVAATEKAGTAKEAADKAVTEAKAKLTELPATASPQEKAAAQKAVTDAEATAKEATAALKTADAKKKSEQRALEDLRIDALRKGNAASKAKKDAEKAKKDADAALKAAGECVWQTGVSSELKGLPAEVVAGTTVDFSFRVSNGTARVVDLNPLFFVHTAQGKAQWLDGTVWKELPDEPSIVAPAKGVKGGSTIEVKVRLTVDAKAKAGKGDALIAGNASDAYNPCILGPMKGYTFKVLPAGSKPAGDTAKPQPVEDKDRPTPPAKPAAGGSTPTAQGGAAATPVTATSATGALAATGSSSAMPQLALAGGAALVLGAGAVVVTRRRKSTDRA